MIYAIHCLDEPDAQSLRQANHPAHRDYLGRAPIKILVAGPLVGDDGETPLGSLFLVEAANRAEVEAFHNNDPLKAAGVWGEVRINSFLKRVDMR
jgi:uncharacterized protein YciI